MIDHLLQIRVLQIRVLQIQSVFYKSNPVHVLQYACSVQQNGQLNYGVVTSLPKSNSLNETILFPTTTRIQTASILTEFDENPDLKHAVGQSKRWELCWGFSVKVQTATNTLIIISFSLLFY